MEGRGERESKKGAESEGRRARREEGIRVHEKSDTIIWDCHCTGILMVTTLLGEDFIEFRSPFV